MAVVTLCAIGLTCGCAKRTDVRAIDLQKEIVRMTNELSEYRSVVLETKNDRNTCAENYRKLSEEHKRLSALWGSVMKKQRLTSRDK